MSVTAPASADQQRPQTAMCTAVANLASQMQEQHQQEQHQQQQVNCSNANHQQAQQSTRVADIQQQKQRAGFDVHGKLHQQQCQSQQPPCPTTAASTTVRMLRSHETADAPRDVWANTSDAASPASSVAVSSCSDAAQASAALPEASDRARKQIEGMPISSLHAKSETECCHGRQAAVAGSPSLVSNAAAEITDKLNEAGGQLRAEADAEQNSRQWLKPDKRASSGPSSPAAEAPDTSCRSSAALQSCLVGTQSFDESAFACVSSDLKLELSTEALNTSGNEQEVRSKTANSVADTYSEVLSTTTASIFASCNACLLQSCAVRSCTEYAITAMHSPCSL